MSINLKHVCDVCGEEIEGREGVVTNNPIAIYRAREKYNELTAEIEKERGRYTLTPELVLNDPFPSWKTVHISCTEEDLNDFDIPTHELKTHEDLLKWTAQLFRKPWFSESKWDAFIRQHI